MSPLSLRTAQAVAAAVAVAKAHGLRVDEPKVLHDIYGVRIHLAPAPVVARVSTLTAILRQPVEAWLARELAVAGFLAERGAPVVAPSDLMPATPFSSGGMAISFWTYVQPLADVSFQNDATLCVRMLAELHAALREYPGELPLLAPPLNDIPAGIARLEQLAIVSAGDLAFLRDEWEALHPQLIAAAAQRQPLHGDAHAGNLIPTAQGLLWNDLEDVCLGPLAWDVSCMDDGSGRVAAAYPEVTDAASLALFRYARLLHAATWGNALLPETLAWREAILAIIPQLKSAAAKRRGGRRTA